MTKKILVYSPNVLVDRHFGTDLELAKKHLISNDDVHFLVCDTSLTFCDLNYEHELEICSRCIIKRNHGLNLLNISKEKIHYLQLNKYRNQIKIPDFRTINELKSFVYDGFDLGMTTFYTLTISLRDPEPDLKKFKKAVENLIISGISLYEGVKNFLSSFAPDIFYLFNGQTNVKKPALRAAQKLGVKTFVHENSVTREKYDLFEDTHSVDLIYLKKYVEDFWNSSTDPNLKEKIARDWFSEQRKKKIGANKNSGLLASNTLKVAIFTYFNPKNQLIDPEWQNTLFFDQEQVIIEVCQSFRPENINFYLFVENEKNERSLEKIRKIESFKFKNLEIIWNNGASNPYQLIDFCDKVISFGSDLGIESVFSGKASILLGRAVYEDLEVCYRPENIEEIIELILQLNLPPLSREKALKYGYWQKNRGIAYSYFQPSGFIEGKFAGFDLNRLNTTRAELAEIQLLFNKMNLQAKPDLNKILDEMKRRKAEQNINKF